MTDQVFIYTRNGTKCRVIHQDDTRVLAAVQIVHQSLTYSGDDFDEYEDDGPIRELSPSQCFDAPPTMQVSEELVRLEKRVHEIRGEITDLGFTLKAVQKEHDEKMAALTERHDALRRLDEFVDGKITHYVLSGYPCPQIVSVEETLEERRHEKGTRTMGRLLSLTPEKLWSGELVWRLNEYDDGSGYEDDVMLCTSYEDGLTHLQAWADKHAEQSNYNRGVINFVKKHKLVLPDGYMTALIAKEKAGLVRLGKDAKVKLETKRKELEIEWRAMEENENL